MSEEFSYTLEDEKILEYLRLSTEDKLNWLEEIVEFNNLVLGERQEEYQALPDKGKSRECD
jgi:hypothetical protein